MRRPVNSGEKPRRARTGLLTGSLLAWLIGAGCENTCVNFNSNAASSTLQVQASDAKVSCRLAAANGTVIVQTGPGVAPSEGRGSSAVHFLISLRGIEAHPGAVADDASGDWVELAQGLEGAPVQVDLLAREASNCALSRLGEAAIPAGVYRQVRLRLVPNRPAVGQPVPEKNGCGSVGWNCIVAADGGIQPLAAETASPELRILAQPIENGLFTVLPEEDVRLSIGLKGDGSLGLQIREAARWAPNLTAAAAASCRSSGGPESDGH